MSTQDTEAPNTRIDYVDRHVSTKLRMRRIMLGLSQQVLGTEVGVSVQQIQKYEKGSNRVSSGKLYHFSNLLEIPITYFFEDLNDKNSSDKTAEPLKGYDTAHEREILTLVKAYNEIPDIQLRKKILDLVKSLSSPN